MPAPVLLLLLSLALSAAAPDLAPEQRQQLETATDGSKLLDEAALYPLLQNAIWWTAGDEEGATKPDLAALLKDPAGGRGRLFILEGRLARLPLLVPKLARQGPWDGKLQQYALLVSTKPDTTVLVYLVDAPPVAKSPRIGETVRVVGRFYKVWKSPNLEGQDALYLTFVGKSGRVIAPSSAPGGLGAAGGLLNDWRVAALGLALLLMAVYAVFRRTIQKLQHQSALRAQQREEAREEEKEPADTGPPLPEDPAEALKELERRQKEQEGRGT
jgi:hypothetical protein